jgi:hypothetical protein
MFLYVFLSAKIHHMHISPESHVIGEIPAHVVGILINHDVVASPIPIAAIADIHRSDAKEKSTKPEPTRAASHEVPYVTTSKAAGEVAVLPRTIEMQGSGVAAVMANPGTVVVNVRGFGVTLLIAEARFGDLGWLAVQRWRTMLWNESAADLMATTLLWESRRGEGDEGQHQDYRKPCEK